MEVNLEILTDREAVLGLAPELDVHAEEITREFRDQPPPPGVFANLVERSFEAPETVVAVVKTDEGQRIGTCVTTPFVDPLLGDRVPMVVLLTVDRNFRHRGVARQLIAAVSRELESRGINTLAARAGHNDDALISMGERWGFTRQWELMIRE